MQLPDLVLFDLAGTTVADHGEVPAAFNAALAEQGIPVTPEQIQAVRGASKRQALLELTPAGPERIRLVEVMYASFRNHLMKRFAAGVEAVPGTEATYRWLRGHAVKVGINTGFDRETAELLLTALGWGTRLFAAVVCGDEVPQGRPAPYLIFHAMQRAAVLDVHRVAVVGDTPNDLLAGYNAGLGWNIGVLSGSHPLPALEAMPHTHILPSVADLPSLWS